MRVAPAASAAVIIAGSGVLAQSDNRTTVAKTIVDDILKIYQNGSTTSTPGFIPGLFPEDYYFWESGLAFDSLINYWAYTDDDAVVDIIRQGMAFQVGPDNNFMPPNQTRSLGNDDQSFWALAAMSAAELGLAAPEGNVSWFDLAKNVFDNQVLRWDEESCAGGLRWQIFTFNNGYNYKNAVSQGNFALLGARLHRFTGNNTYLEWAERAVQWATNTGLITSGRDTAAAIYDGTDVTANCSDINRIQWTINAGQFMNAFAYACNTTCSDAWKEVGRVAVATTTSTFAANSSILSEVACASTGRCNVDQLAYRAPLARALANARDMAGETDVGSIISESAGGAIGQCSSDNGCGSDWAAETWDGTSGLGQDLSALEIILATLPRKQLATSNSTGGSSGGSSGGGSGSGSGNGTAGGSSGSSGSSGNTNAATSNLAPAIASLAITGLAAAMMALL